ncbi:MAG: DNA polymerase III subunit alpha [Gammaproteobacteria bacterium]|nr:DNA polymerase III subunit alpha [Gammaproteobacteria bacterium]
MTQFVHLRTHSEYSMVDGLFRVRELVGQAADCGMPAIALTDDSNLFASIKFYRACLLQGVQPIIGADCWVKSEVSFARLTLIAMNQEGYKNLLELVSLGWLRGQDGDYALLDWEWVADHSAGLICLTGATEGEIGRLVVAGQHDKASTALEKYHSVFTDRLYFELTRVGLPGETALAHFGVAAADRLQIPLVATNVACFGQVDDFEAHETRVCIHESVTLDDQRRVHRHTPEQWLKSQETMIELFSDLPDAITNTVRIAKRCGVELTLGSHFLPEYPVPDGMTLDEYFHKFSHNGLTNRLETSNSYGQALNEAVYRDRLDFEVRVIQQMGFPGYFLIVADFIQWAKDHSIPVGPGRGSGAGSIVAWALKITDLDPIEHELLFERFLNPERVSMPDFDIDFCMEGRDRVIDYVAERYGRYSVSQIVTFGSMAAKAVVRDVTRVQGKPYSLGDRLAKLIPFEVGMTLDKAFEAEPQLKKLVEDDDEVREVWDMALKLEGLSRNTGKHAGGVVIAPGKLTEFTALLSAEDGSSLVTQLDKDDVEAAGLVKFDFLGLRTLTIIDWTLDLIQETRSEALVIERIPMADPEVLQLLCRGETTAVFQLESRGMKELIRRLKPNSFEDIVALVALFRPGPLQSGMVDDFINRKHGRAKVEYPHPDLGPILKNTYGVILYQEQVMQIAQVLANYSLGGADLLRRAMGKKKPEEMEKQREIFLKGTSERGINPILSSSIFDLMAKFAGYGFNKSHSAAYALVSYQTAFLKTHYPAEFMAAVLSSDMDNTDKVVPLIEECRRMGLTVRPPDVNVGAFRFAVKDGEVIYGLGAIKGLGEGPTRELVGSRKLVGTFVNLFDFCRRVGASKVNRRALEALIRAGAFDSLNEPRWVLMSSLEDAISEADQQARNEAVGIADMFGLGVGSDTGVSADPYQHHRSAIAWSEHEILRGEKETLGLYLTGHPIDWYADDLKGLGAKPLENLDRTRDTIRVVGLIVGLRVIRNKRGDSFGIITIDDRTARIDVTVFADLFADCREKLIDDTLVVIEGNVSFDEFTNGLKMRASKVETLEDARKLSASSLKIYLENRPPEFADTLVSTIQPYLGGECPVIIEYNAQHVSGEIVLGDHYLVYPNDSLLMELQELLGRDRVHLDFSARTQQRA